jgi:peptidoglycan/LPS O-acetylase OafA/YrhL
MFRTWTLWANCDGLLLGAFLCRLEASGKDLPLSRTALGPMALALVGLAAILSPQSRWYSPIASVLVAAIAAWLVWHSRHPLGGIAGRVLSHPGVVYLGRISYGVYLYHVITPGLANAIGLTKAPGIWRLFETGTPQGFVAHCAIVVGVAALSYHYFETPIRNLAFARKPAKAIVST